ncbi:hypothetical protein VQ042_25065, partial [Aurantimonas sp. A2-1-M11]|uniref:hypothetical protein n=1 Tax=Aurantimonas sp. A2-1-M11 TaxID=3113712 RepID=UPI002F9247BF
MQVNKQDTERGRVFAMRGDDPTKTVATVLISASSTRQGEPFEKPLTHLAAALDQFAAQANAADATLKTDARNERVRTCA